MLPENAEQDLVYLPNWPGVPNDEVGTNPGPGTGTTSIAWYDPVKEITVWRNSDGLTGVRVLAGRQEPQMLGVASGDSKTLTFEPGESCQHMSLWDNGPDTRVARIKIETKRQTLDFGDGKREQVMNVGSGFLIGFQTFCKEEGELTAFSPLFLLPFKSLISTVRYKNPPVGKAGINFRQLDSYIHANDSPWPYAWSWSRSIDKTVSDTWSQEIALSFGMSLSVSAGVPEIVEIGGEVHWDMSLTASHEISETETRTLSWNESGEIPPHRKLSCQIHRHFGNRRLRTGFLCREWNIPRSEVFVGPC
ncbi:hypothetical protein N7476_010014 [Penicillium atrosanguineum]|uniref:Jacalin-type lectin domain-containing protein n=1 Tax=Penicillium atrosanguineum TaxID=1132637 RepID=A0A9W9PPF4_9EURO|nr:hypothetical protein N7526_007827 [Penicillium atrosanguineum]KAJ5303215.1 hypothetical protein N7476_010014 [Penicillium atrosanguineum]